MDVKFQFHDAPQPEPVVFDSIFAEKQGGGTVANPSYDIPRGTAVGRGADNKFHPIKAYVLVKGVAVADTSIHIAKGSGVAVGDIIATGKKGVAVTAVNQTNSGFDVVSVSLQQEIENGKVLYQAKEATDDETEAVPVYEPEYLVGVPVEKGQGDQLVKLVNGANVRKETAPVADEIVKLMPGIKKV